VISESMVVASAECALLESFRRLFSGKFQKKHSLSLCYESFCYGTYTKV
jgi:hypothetical protein